jgi:hypothetical protein
MIEWAMPRLPDRFDLQVRKARQCTDPARQVDYVLGAMAALRDWHFFNVANRGSPQPAEVEIDGARHLLVFSGTDRIEEWVPPGAPLPLISIPTAGAMPWALERRCGGCEGLLVNPGEDAFSLSMEHVAHFHEAWSLRGGLLSSGFWIPNMTSEEEDFWQEHGL